MQETQALLVKPVKTSNVIVAQIQSKTSVGMISADVSNSIIDERLNDITSVLSGEGVDDPTMKKCSKCFKAGRQAWHPIDDFSIIQKTGKRSSQCKKCKSDAATAWCKSKAEHRAAYHKNYRAERKTRSTSKAIAILKDVPEVDESMPEAFKGRKGLESLFAAYKGNNISLATG